MLDTETKRRIDTARDILVGVVPVPMSQVDQITIALIYKFMDDMDQESVSMGGKATFFSGDYEKFAWNRIFDPRMGGQEMLNLYAEAITRMEQNPHLPQLFRSIFRNAYLPYRDPATLKLFLKTINEFKYDHSERLGDAFEYLLSVLGSQGDAGQFRTPRHIIDFMVEVMKPQKHEIVLDPACGTAGFLIAAYKHILRANMRTTPGDLLQPAERAALLNNFTGYDISPDMARLSRVNLYLHGFVQPKIFEYDTLTSEERWNEYADVILANPPFMSPKGGIRPHKRFSVQSNRSEVLFVDYMAEHLTPAGRAAIIVPEGIIFQSAGAYKQLRKYLAENNYLWAVVSLPAGVFQPYSGVKTSILFLDRALAKQTDQVLFIKVNADGFSLGAQRREAEANDLPAALAVLEAWQTAVKEQAAAGFDPARWNAQALPVAVERLAQDGDYQLSIDRYRDNGIRRNEKYPMVSLGEVCEIAGEYGSNSRKVDFNNTVRYIRITDINNEGILKTDEVVSPSEIEPNLFLKYGDLLIARSGSVGRVYIHQQKDGYFQFAGYLLRYRPKKDLLLPSYLFYILKSDSWWEWIITQSKTGTLTNINSKQYNSFQIPLPPLEVQQQMVAEIEGYQRVIDGARMVVEHWQPALELELERERLSAGVEAWPSVKLGEVCEVKGGKRIPKGESFAHGKTDHPYIRVIDLNNGTVDLTDLKFITDEIFLVIKNYTISRNDVYISIAGTIGLFGTIPDELDGANLTENAAKLVFDKTKIDKHFLKYVGNSHNIHEQVKALTQGVGVPKLALERIRTIEIPLPPLAVQQTIVTHIKAERAAVEASRTLIERMQANIQSVIARVW